MKRKAPQRPTPEDLDATRIAAVALHWKVTGKRISPEPLSDAERDDARKFALIWWGPIPEHDEKTVSRKLGAPLSGAALDAMLLAGTKQSAKNHQWLTAFIDVNPIVRKARANEARLKGQLPDANKGKQKKAKEDRAKREAEIVLLTAEAERLRGLHPRWFKKQIVAELKGFCKSRGYQIPNTVIEREVPIPPRR